jgi:sugar phosphate isomerase/epimerase
MEPTMKLACADFTFPLLSHEKSLDLIAALEFDGVDIGLFENRSHLWPSTQFADVEGSAKKLKRQLDDRGLRAADVFLQVDADLHAYTINHPESARRDRARDWFGRTMDYAAALAANHVTALPGMPIDGEQAEVSRARAVDELQWRVAEAAKRRIDFGVEPHLGSIACNPAAAAALLKDVPGLTWTLDYTHFTRQGIPDATTEPLLENATHFHVRGAREGRLQAPFKKNVIDYRRIYDRMREWHYDGWIGIEYVWMDWEHCDECDNVSETILFRDFFRSMA